MRGGRAGRRRAGELGACAVLLGAMMAAAPAWADERPTPRPTGQYYRARPVAKLPRARLAPLVPVAQAPEPAPDTTLADALAQAYRANPTLEARRYDLRATDENLGLALSELRPTSELQVTGQYQKIVPGRTTQATRFGASSPIEVSNSLGAQLIVNQPLSTGGRATADISAAQAGIRAGRAGLRAAEGDLLLQTIAAYLDVRRDTRTLAIRQGNLAQLAATLDEVKARREAGELTRTDVAQAETQLGNAQEQYNLTREQLEQSRATYAALVGVDPGSLAPEPPLPQLPASADEAFAAAEALNPDLAQARFAEAASRQRIAAARAASRPTLSLQGIVGLTGQAVPFYLHNEDQSVTVRGVLTIPLTNGGHNGAAIAQAEDTNGGDRLRIEAARRAMVLAIANAWNQMVTARRNQAVGERQMQSARIFYEGSFAEYRAGLRSTFDVLYAQGTLRDAEIALVAARHDLYVAQAALLRHVGLLEVRDLATGVGLYDASADVRHVERRGAMPWDAGVRGLDRIGKPGTRTRALEQPPALPEPARLAPAAAAPVDDRYVTSSPNVPQGGTVGRPVNALEPH
jgi:outer membrane protein